MLTLVTGGAGFLGSHLVDALIAAGDTVVVIDNLSTGRLRNLESAVTTGRTTFAYADVARSTQATQSLLAENGATKLDRIFHLASPASPKAYGEHQWATLAVNGIGSMSLIEIALAHGAQFVFASTSEIYGDPLVHPQPETYFGNVDPIGPRSCYDEGKRFGEAAVAAAVSERGLDGRIARFFNCYGPRMDDQDGRLIPAMLDAVSNGKPFPIHGTGRQTRSMTYVEDAVAGLLHLSASPGDVLRPMNVGNDDERSVEEIARAVAEVAGVTFRADYIASRPQDPQRRRPDLTFARSMGWSPTTDLTTGLRSTLQWYHQDRHAFA
ncbi:MAG: SDR family oxidoreductase [Vulcanimicrobiaceae bacterium]